MKKKLIIASIILVLAALYAFRNYDGKPGHFLSVQDTLESINNYYVEAGANEILDVIHLDSSHVYVPFISISGNYSMSFWIWDRMKWRVVAVDTNGYPYIWKLSQSDPTKQFIMWNTHPKKPISEIDFYLIRERTYHIENGVSFYTPRVQLRQSASMKESTYGTLTFPKEWQEIAEVDAYAKREDSGILSTLIGNNQISKLYVGWLPHYNGNSEDLGSFYSSSTMNRNWQLESIRMLNESELERP
ncbi:hypothetical protein [Paenibacillus sp. L3-i20]|uniref:hypothetical protein n=1 Tax=Paenibacillus sp. L3-i20 TaxID=2905833 RepID=UPI001EDD60EF|nr:hypothetical protein [Paenibacillus sp. L3-i20]GKU76480.1 hypothetical protein L3i20_v208770 [Paenibacillus sp. L3-i20]